MRHIRRGVLAGMASAALLVSCTSVDEKQVSDAARDDVVGSAKVVHEIDSGTNGSTSLEVRYLVLDLGEQDAAAAADAEAEQLEKAGWRISAGTPPRRYGGSSTETNATVAVYVLTEYLEDDRYSEDIESELRKSVPNPDGMILVVVEPRT